MSVEPTTATAAACSPTMRVVTPGTAADEKAAAVHTVLEQLPEWFGVAEWRSYYADNARALTMLLACDNAGPVGVLTLRGHYTVHAEIDVLGIVPRFHGTGLGRRLIASACDTARANGASYLSVKTVAESQPDPFYERTRKFYRAVGFKDFEQIDNHWGDGMDCLVLLQPLKPA
ncbi:MAG: GNAT family N-acetyltransferase [Pseudomonadota bacterium]